MAKLRKKFNLIPVLIFLIILSQLFLYSKLSDKQANSDSKIAVPTKIEFLEGREDVPVYGYYKSLERTAWGVKAMCDVLVVTGGDSLLISTLEDMVERGNTVNSLDENGNLLMNIETEKLSVQDSERILNSTVSNPANLLVAEKVPEGRAASVCHSFVSITSVE